MQLTPKHAKVVTLVTHWSETKYFNIFNIDTMIIRPVLGDHCSERPPVLHMLKDHIFLV